MAATGQPLSDSVGAFGGAAAATAVAAPSGEQGRARFQDQLREWAQKAAARHVAEAPRRDSSGGPVLAGLEFERLGVVEVMRAAAREAVGVYGQPPVDWLHYHPWPPRPVHGMTHTEIVLAAGSVPHVSENLDDPLGGRERLVPRVSLRVTLHYASGRMEVGRLSRPAEEWTSASFEDAVLAELAAAEEAPLVD